MGALCSVCGHGVYYHVKGGVLDPKACLVGGLTCASHTFASTNSAHARLSKFIFKAEPISYFTLNNTPNDSGGMNSDGTWTGTPAYTTGVNGDANGAGNFTGACLRVQ